MYLLKHVACLHHLPALSSCKALVTIKLAQFPEHLRKEIVNLLLNRQTLERQQLCFKSFTVKDDFHSVLRSLAAKFFHQVIRERTKHKAVYKIITIYWTFFFFSLPGKGGSFSNKVARSADHFKFEDIFSGRFSPQGYSCDWISGKFSKCIILYMYENCFL